MRGSAIALVIGFTFVIVAAGCGGSSSTTNPSPAAALSIQSGNWSILATSSANPGQPFAIGGSLSQSGSTISGIMHLFIDTLCINSSTDIPLSGMVSGQKVTLTSPVVDGAVLTVNASGNAMSLSGTYTVTASGTTCTAGTDQGSFTASLVPSITGTWHGSLVSTGTGPTLNVTANLTQSATPDAHGFFPVTGTFSFTGSTCFTSGNIVNTPSASSLAGSILEVNISTNDQPTAGAMILGAGADIPSSANTFSAVWAVSVGNCSGEGGTGNLSRP